MSALEHLDSVIAFVAIISGVSLVVTTLTQTLSAALGLRGRHLRWGLEELIEQLDPQLGSAAASVSHVLLTHPLVSDSMFARRSIVARWFALTGLLRLWQGWKYASALRAPELRGLIEKLGAGSATWLVPMESILQSLGTLEMAAKLKGANPAAVKALRESLQNLRQQPSLDPYWHEALQRLAQPLWAGVGEGREFKDPSAVLFAANRLRDLLRAMRGIQWLAEKVANLETQTAEERRRLIGEFERLAGTAQAAPWLQSSFAARLQEIRHPLDRWFDASMDRVSQHFGSHLRLWTVGFAFLVAFGLQVDAIRLFRRLSSDATLRASVVARTDGLLRRMEETTNAPANAVASYRDALEVVLARPSDGRFTNLVETLRIHAPFANVGEATNWLAATLRSLGTNAPTATESGRLIAEFEREVDRAPLLGAVNRFQSALEDEFVVDLIPKRFAWPWSSSARGSFLGTLVTGVFLSLGAPFWFNLLKNLSNLRPILASKQQAEHENPKR